MTRPGIALQLIAINLLLVAMFAAMIMFTFYSFGTVEQLVSRTVTSDVGQNMANAGVLRELSGIFSQTNLLLGNFIKNEKELEAQGARLVAATERLAGGSSDRRLTAPLREYVRRLHDLFAACARINVILRQIEQQELRQHREVDALDRTISDSKIKLILKGHDPAIMDQLAVLSTGFHDSMQEINLLFFRTISDKSAAVDSARRAQLFAMVDDLTLRLQTLTASEPQIAVYGPRIVASVKAYGAAIRSYFRAQEELETEKARQEEVKAKVIGVMQRIDEELSVTTGGISKHVHDIMIASRRNVLLIAAGLGLVSGIAVLIFINSAIRRPMALINKGIEEIAAGNLDTMINLNRNDEWTHIETALNRMAGELRQSYAELAQQHDRLEIMVQERTSELEQTQAELVKREKLAVLGQLTATVSHELRNPLGVIRSSAFYLQNRLGNRDEKVAKHLARIDQHVGLCDGIVADLLEFTRGRLSEKSPGDVNDWLTGILDTVRLPDGVVLERSLTPDLPVLCFDPDKLRRVVQNLLENAIYAVSGKADTCRHDGVNYVPRIKVATSLGAEHICLVIDDNGSGMDQATLERTFEPLFTTRAQGTGLGLAIVRKIVEEHGGTVTIASTPDSGTRVTALLPPSGAVPAA